MFSLRATVRQHCLPLRPGVGGAAAGVGCRNVPVGKQVMLSDGSHFELRSIQFFGAAFDCRWLQSL